MQHTPISPSCQELSTFRRPCAPLRARLQGGLGKGLSFLFAALLTILQAGCVPLWTEAAGRQHLPEAGFAVELPSGWMRLGRTDRLVATQDGLMLQQIAVTREQFDGKLETTKKQITKDMLPQEVSEVLIDALQGDSNVLHFQLIENRPATIASHSGFRFQYSYQNTNEFRVQSVCYGFVAGPWLYRLRYTAAARAYFDRDLAAFEKAVASFTLDPITASLSARQ